MEDRQKALDKATIALMSTPDSAFIVTVYLSMVRKWDDTIRTACTNGKEIRFNTEFFMKLTPAERVFLLMHEAWHVCFMHMERLNTRDHAKWNVAGDHVINLMLIERGFKMPKMGLADPQYKGMSTDEVYNLLPTQDPSKVDMDLEPSEDDEEKLHQDLQEVIIRASVQSKMQGDKEGSIPGEIQIFLECLLAPKLPWNRILQRYLKAKAKSDYSFRKPNRRFFPQYHLPSLHSESLMNLTIAIDASGSVSDHDFTHFVSEIHSIFKMMKPEKITLIQFDTQINSVEVIRSIQELSKVTFSGKGGTRISPILEWANTNKPDLMMVFTDGEFGFYENTTRTDTLWLIHNNPDFTTPVGKVIHYEI